MKNLTCNQLLDKFSEIKIDSMTPELGKKRQQLIELKRSTPKGGLMLIEESEEILNLINNAKK
jgi:hypothetical protein